MEEIALLNDRHKDYLWTHFSMNAGQRIQTFNFFVVFSVFANGGVFTAFEKAYHPLALVLIGGFILIISAVFYWVDRRSRHLLDLSIAGLKKWENQQPVAAHLFTVDVRSRFKPSYTTAFRFLHAVEFMFGLGVLVVGVVKLFCLSR
jgi:hypothetical protein